MKAIKQYFPVVLFLMLESMDEILKYNHSKAIEQHFPLVLSTFNFWPTGNQNQSLRVDGSSTGNYVFLCQ